MNGSAGRLQFSGIVHGPRHLHHIATLASDAFPDIDLRGLMGLSLFYGMCFSYCSMSYRVTGTNRYALMELEPTESSKDWPYPDYPDLVPSIPLRLARRIPCSRDRFDDLLAQPITFEADELIVVVPPISDLGMSLWGDDGDAEGLQIIFKYDLRARIVRAYNVCS